IQSLSQAYFTNRPRKTTKASAPVPTSSFGPRVVAKSGPRMSGAGLDGGATGAGGAGGGTLSAGRGTARAGTATAGGVSGGAGAAAGPRSPSTSRRSRSTSARKARTSERSVVLRTKAARARAGTTNSTPARKTTSRGISSIAAPRALRHQATPGPRPAMTVREVSILADRAGHGHEADGQHAALIVQGTVPGDEEQLLVL